MKYLLSGLAVVAMALALVAPAGAQAASTSTQPATLSYTTTLSDWNYGRIAYPYNGQLKLQMQPDGTINGWYTNDDAIMRAPVIGGQSGKYLWLDIGDTGRLHVNAQLQGSALVGTATEGNRMFDFTAEPVM